jgi:superfamily II RNA helicase
MLPVYKEIVERLFTTGLVRLLFTTETFAVGVNMPARSVVFSSLRKYDGVGFSYLSTLGYYQMAGRAGRQGMDKEGNVYTVVNPEYDTQKDIKGVIFGKVEPLTSRFNLSYSAVLSLYRSLKGELDQALELSFSAWQSNGSPKKLRAMLQARLSTLAKEGYLVLGGELTGKGRLAAKLNGYEMQMAELYWAGCFEHTTPEDCAVLVVSVVHEARRSDFSHRVEDQSLGSIRNRANKRIRAFRKTETLHGITSPIKNLDFSLSGTIRAWCDGVKFAELANFTSTQDGDIVRTLRMAIQVLRQFAEAIKEDGSLRERLLKSVELLNRDEVDAEKQLRLG